MKYKVIKEFNSLKKGDILENSTEDPCIFSLEEETDNGYRYISMSDNIVDTYVEHGYLLEVKEEDQSKDDSLDRIAAAVNQIDNMLAEYEKDNADITNRFTNNEIPYCAKLEADTVHFNLIKALNKIKNILLHE